MLSAQAITNFLISLEIMGLGNGRNFYRYPCHYAGCLSAGKDRWQTEDFQD
jgi:hypothetical protein